MKKDLEICETVLEMYFVDNWQTKCADQPFQSDSFSHTLPAHFVIYHHIAYCHDLWQNSAAPGVDVIIGKKPTHHTTTTTPGVSTIRAVPGNPGIWFLVWNLSLTKQEEIWKKLKHYQSIQWDPFLPIPLFCNLNQSPGSITVLFD